MKRFEITKYHNDFNRVGLRGFTAEELNLLMTILHKLKNNDTKTLNFEFFELKDLIKLDKNMTVKEFAKAIMNVNKKLLALNFTITTEDLIIQFALFQEFVIDLKTQNLRIAVSERFKFLLNDFEPGQWTRFELEEFVDLKSSYTKEFYRRMKQFRSTGVWKVSIDDFKRLLDIPVNYRMCDIDVKVLKPIENELKKKYQLKIRKEYGKAGLRGRSKVTGFIFTFLKEEVPGTEKNKNLEKTKNLTGYIGRKVRMHDSKFNRYNVMNIRSVEGEETVSVELQNVDDEYVQIFAFDSRDHFINWFEKNKI